MKKKQKLILGCVAAFTLSQILIILIHLVVDGAMPVFSRSISQYIGMPWWSAIIFALGDFIVAGLVWQYFMDMRQERRMPKISWLFDILMLVGLIGLSVCPMGLFAAPDGADIVRRFHEFFSRMMFCSAICWTLISSITYRKQKFVLPLGLCFVTYGILFVISYVIDSPILFGAFFTFEEVFLYGFFVYLFVLGSKKSKSS